MLVLLVLTGGFGFDGMSRSLFIITDEEAPLVDMAMEEYVQTQEATIQ